MKRQCTEAEKKLLYKNREQILTGECWSKFKIKEEDFLKQQNIMINGATIVEIDGGGRFSCIEDDFLDEEGNPIIIGYPSCPVGLTPEDVGKRILLLYDREYNFRFVRLNAELSSLIPENSPGYPLTKASSEYMHVPHPNVTKIEKTGHEVSGSEREMFAELHREVVQGVAFKMAKVLYAVLAFILLILCFLLDNVEGGYPLSQTVPIAVAGYFGLLLFYGLMTCLGRVNIRRKGQFVYVKEAVFCSVTPKENVYTVYIYEWVDGKLQIREYEDEMDLLTHAVYGDVLYNFTNRKGIAVLQIK